MNPQKALPVAHALDEQDCESQHPAYPPEALDEVEVVEEE
jgi:hypothetical protein